MTNLSLLDVPFELVTCESPMFVCTTPAGFPSPAQDDMEEPIDLAAWLVDHPAASYVMRVAGHSMVEAGINDGDLVVVSRAVEARPGDIVVALVHGDRTMKRLQRRGDRMWLVPEAEGYDAIRIDENVEIWGVVVALARRYRA
jgi:DNA polymerase V